ncbi:adenosylcobinamide amidohydrolase [Neobacillus mesonae]|nr:adenosylcobinamide amidohydrolase [Neobacillus mesonae]
MSVPFLHTESQVGVPSVSEIYSSKLWSGLTLTKFDAYLLLESPQTLHSLASSIYGGGMDRIDRAVNIYVDKHFASDDPAAEIQARLHHWRVPTQRTAGLLTAVKLSRASIIEQETDHAVVFCCTTAGVGNSARAASSRTVFSAAYSPGTINIMLCIAGQLTPYAMVNALQTAVEAKAAALQDLGVKDAENGQIATGTTTDAIVLGVSGSNPDGSSADKIHAYAGTATKLGDCIGRLVYGTVTESLLAGEGEAGSCLL